MHAEVEAARELAAQVEARDVGDAGVLLALERARRRSARRTAARAAAPGRAASWRADCSRRATTRTTLSMSLCSSYLSSRRSNTIHRLESGRNAQAKRPTALGAAAAERRGRIERLQRHRHGMTFDRLAIPARGRAPALLAVGVAMLETAGRSARAPGDTARRRTRRRSLPSSNPRPAAHSDSAARGPGRAACCSGRRRCRTPVLLPLEALREAEVGERARTELRRLRVDARIDLRAIPWPRAHADARDVGFDLAPSACSYSAYSVDLARQL